ncbi:MAG: FHA domain-containing protein [Oscillospiraceae bacterium]|nr:FHA domain-containing protein [Oscillospiraceae bacterium]
MKFTIKHGLLIFIALAVAALLLPWGIFGNVTGLAAGVFGSVGSIPTISVNGAYIGASCSAALVEFFEYVEIVSLTGAALNFWWWLLIYVVICVILAGFLLPVISLFLCLFTRSKRATIAILSMQSISALIAIVELILLVWAENYVSLTSAFQMGAGPVVYLVALLASVIVAAMIVKRYVEKEPKVVPTGIGSGLICLAGEYRGITIPMISGAKVTLGRDATFCNLVLSGSKISRKHCEIEYLGVGGKYRVTDYSTNGVFVKGGSKLDRGTAVELSSGTVICLGNDLNMFQLQ